MFCSRNKCSNIRNYMSFDVMLEMGRDQKGPFALWAIVILHANFEADVMKEIWLWFCGFLWNWNFATKKKCSFGDKHLKFSSRITHVSCESTRQQIFWNSPYLQRFFFNSFLVPSKMQFEISLVNNSKWNENSKRKFELLQSKTAKDHVRIGFWTLLNATERVDRFKCAQL